MRFKYKAVTLVVPSALKAGICAGPERSVEAKMNRTLFLVAIGLLATAPGAVAQNTTALNAVRQNSVDSTTQTEDVGFRNDGFERMTVAVRVSGNGPYRFLVDTGADRTAVSRELAGKLKLPPGRTESLHTLGGVSGVQTANVSSLQLTRHQVKVGNAALLDRADMGADGILGVDSLRSQRVLFDFEAQTMSIVPSATRDAQADRDAIVVRARRNKGRLVISEARADSHRTAIILDTGAQVSIGNHALRRKLLGNRPVDPAQRLELLTVTGQRVAGEFVFIDKLEVDGLTIKKLGIVFADAHTFRALKLDRKPAMLLGMNAMRAFKRISIDFAAKKLRVVLPEESSLDTRIAAAERRARS
jgi:predicted aspartyl protease